MFFLGIEVSDKGVQAGMGLGKFFLRGRCLWSSTRAPIFFFSSCKRPARRPIAGGEFRRLELGIRFCTVDPLKCPANRRLCSSAINRRTFCVMGATGSSLKAKADAIRAHTRRAKEDNQAVDLQTQIQAQEQELEGLQKSYRSIKVRFRSRAAVSALPGGSVVGYTKFLALGPLNLSSARSNFGVAFSALLAHLVQQLSLLSRP